MNKERYRREVGHDAYPLECRLSVSVTNTTKILSTRYPNILMKSSSEYLFLESECYFTKNGSPCPHKTEEMIISRKTRQIDHPRVTMNNVVVNRVSSHKHLAVVMSVLGTSTFLKSLQKRGNG